MTFSITINYDRKNIRLTVTQLFIDNRTERYKVAAGNGDIVVESNRPLFRNKGLKHRPPNWKQVEGNSLNSHVLEKIFEAIQSHVDS